MRAFELARAVLFGLDMRPIRVLSAAAIALAALGCSDDPKPPPRTAADAPSAGGAPAPRPETPVRSDAAADVRIDPRIAKSCGLDATHFDFDSASVRPEARRVLDTIAQCFTSGPLEGKAMRLVGHADPRGEVDYNFALGQRRAGSVGEYLKAKGVRDEKLTTTSRGELDASGSDEAGWREDRRVEVLLDE